MNHNTSTLTSLSLDSLQIKTTVAVLLAACMVPILVHMIPPYQGIPIGALLLPMFYIPFIAISFFRLHIGLIAAALAPVLNFLLTGNPQWQIVAILSFELVVFVLIARGLLHTKGIKWIAAPLAYLMTKVISSSALLLIPVLPETEPVVFFLTSVSNGIAGILILGLLNTAIVAYQQHK